MSHLEDCHVVGNLDPLTGRLDHLRSHSYHLVCHLWGDMVRGCSAGETEKKGEGAVVEPYTGWLRKGVGAKENIPPTTIFQRRYLNI